MGMFPVGVVPARDEGDSRMLRLTAEHLVVFHLQAEPGAAVAPGADAVEIGPACCAGSVVSRR